MGYTKGGSKGVSCVKRRKVLLTVTGVTSDFGETDAGMRLVTTGTLTGEKGRWKLRCEESLMDTPFFVPSAITMAREGSWGTNMVFQRGRRFETSYNTPFGACGMGIFPTQVNYSVDDSGEGEIALRYQLDIQGQFSSVNDLRISFSANPQA